MKRVLRLIDSISICSGKATAILCVLMVVFIIYEVILRHILNLPTQWVSEATVFCGALLYVIAGAWTLLKDQHVKVDLLYDRFSPKAKAYLDILSFVFFSIYMIAMLWATFIYATDSIDLLEHTGSSWNPPIYPLKVAFFIGVLLIMLQGINGLIRSIYFIKHGQKI
jgi:TRAP-type mannitol/chloroaromatic compound transport system permease small subunit